MSLGENLHLKNKPVSSESFYSDIRKLITKVTGLNPNIRVLIFGSVANDNATTYSDIDMAVIAQDLEQKKNLQTNFFKLKRNITCNADIIFLTQEQMINDIDHPIAQVIKNEGIEVYPSWNLTNGQ